MAIRGVPSGPTPVRMIWVPPGIFSKASVIIFFGNNAWAVFTCININNTCHSKLYL